MLVKLCSETEPDIPSDKQLFTEHSISVQEMVNEVRDLHTGKQNIDPDSERKLLINVMKESNRIWRLRNKVKNGEWDSLSQLEMDEEIEDYLAQNQKINAIKYYRAEMKDRFDEEVSLREAKDYIDQLHNDMKRRKVLQK
jgi:ribosomal protein L7/L12